LLGEGLGCLLLTTVQADSGGLRRLRWLLVVAVGCLSDSVAGRFARRAGR
jgi:hypothetical protein